jgi:hypothetical protein
VRHTGFLGDLPWCAGASVLPRPALKGSGGVVRGRTRLLGAVRGMGRHGDRSGRETEMGWLFELDGEASDKLALKPLASACNCVIRPGPDARLWLGGTKFDSSTTPEQALEEAKKTLVQLNGLARLENPQLDASHQLACQGNQRPHPSERGTGRRRWGRPSRGSSESRTPPR